MSSKRSSEDNAIDEDCDSDEKNVNQFEIVTYDSNLEDSISDSEQIISDDGQIGKDGTIWKKLTSSITGRILAHNIFKAKPGPKKSNIISAYDVWKQFI